MDCRTAIGQGLAKAMEDDPKVLLLGEDIVDPYGGAFKVTRGISTRWPDRVFASPISEAALVGIGNGLALSGWKPVVEIMFGDFVTLAVDQLVNHAAKFRAMYGGKVSVPLLVRTPMGGRRGYGPTHSQSLETLLLGTPGLEVVSANEIVDLTEIVSTTIAELRDPVLFLENKSMYGRENRTCADSRLDAFRVKTPEGGGRFDRILSLRGFTGGDLTIVSHGGMVPLVVEAATHLAIEDEIFADIAIPARLHPAGMEWIADSARSTGALLVAEESQIPWGFGAEVLASVAERGVQARMGRVGPARGVVPAGADAEAAHLPQVGDVVRAARALLGGGR